MSERWARLLLSTYRVAGAAAYPLARPYVAWRASKGAPFADPAAPSRSAAAARLRLT